MSVCKGKEIIEMISVTVEIREGALAHRTRVSAPSIQRALKIAGGGKPSRKVSLVFPIEPETFFVTADPVRKEAA